MRAALRAGGPLTLGFVSAAILLAGIAVWAAQVPVAGAVHATGEVDAAALGRPVDPPEGGIVAEVAVTEGQMVAAGDLVLRLDGGALTHEWNLVDSQRIEAEARVLRLRAERDGTAFPPADPAADAGVRAAVAAQRRLFDARALTLRRHREQLDLRATQIAAELAGIAAQADALRAEADLLHAELARQERLRDQGLTTDLRATELAREAARLAGAGAALQARRAELSGQAAEVALQGETLVALRREEAETQLAETDARLLELMLRRTTLAERRARLELRAPIAGRVLGLAVSGPGPVIAAGETVATIIPPDAGVTVTLTVRADDVDRVRPGQAAVLRVPAFADAGLPDLQAEVRDIAAAVLADSRTGARHIRVRVALTPEGQAALGGRSLLPGMTVQGFLLTDPRTPLGYLIAPVAEAMQRALREP